MTAAETTTGLKTLPTTPKEWQEAVDVAEMMLLIDSARRYGLIIGGPEINVGRCEELLNIGEDLGYLPAPPHVLVNKFL